MDEILEGEFYTLTDEDGNENQFELIASCEMNGNVYLALVPVDEDQEELEEYVILKRELDSEGEEILVTIDDDEEFDRVADLFDEEFSEIDYDSDSEETEE